ncbi:hypothetical protein BJV82DRAFT_663012 [Fennellomyces sp. T-0311]|nr:hypothetical protein BJV82DRAFT_663012 [Fennellomyces sp. T-0311]
MPISAAEKTATTTSNPDSNPSNDRATLKMTQDPSSGAHDSTKQQSSEVTQQDPMSQNEDYQSTLSALNLLRHQLKRATKDVETLTTLKKQALENPYEFVADLKDKKSRRRVPKLQKIATVPLIDWSKYRFIPDSRVAEQTAYLAGLAQSIGKPASTFRNILDYSGPFYRSEPSSPSSSVSYLKRETAKVSRAVRELPSRAGSVSEGSDKESDDEASKDDSSVGKGKGNRRTSIAQSGTMMASVPVESSPVFWKSSDSTPPRPRFPMYESDGIDEILMEHDMHIESRTPTYNQPWTDEEQRRLEELLEIYPDEAVQAQRYNKIAKALGTRSARQVASRVQKYFIKLAKLGLPVPGRVSIPPSSIPKNTRGGANRRGKITKVKARGGSSIRGAKPAMRTSGVGYNTMVSGGITNTRISGAHYLTTHGPPSALMSDDEEDNVKQSMLNVSKPNGSDERPESAGVEAGSGEVVVHEGYACDGCGIEPIIGVRYKCTVCDISEEIDLCSKCMVAGTFQNDQHTPDHPFEAIHVANPLPYYADNDYAPNEYMGEYSYLGL